jgi:hypothetical protein
MRSSEFSHFFCELQEEIGRQAFFALAELRLAEEAARTGRSKRKKKPAPDAIATLDIERLCYLLQYFSPSPVPPGVLAAIRETASQSEKKTYSYTEFLAYSYVTNHIPAVCNVLTSAISAKAKAGKGDLNEQYITKDDFKVRLCLLQSCLAFLLLSIYSPCSSFSF